MPDSYFAESDESGAPVFNMAVSYLNQINVLFIRANDASMQSENGIKEWFECLKSIYRPLHPVLKKCKNGELERSKELLIKIEEDILLFQKRMDALKRNNKYGRPMTVKSNVHRYLDELHTLFYDVAYDKGLLMPETSDPRFIAMGGRR